MTDHDSRTTRAVRLIVRASQILDGLNPTVGDIALLKASAAMKLSAGHTPNDHHQVAIALMRTALVLVDGNGRHDVACHLQGALDTALDRRSARHEGDIDADLIDAILPPLQHHGD